MSTSDDSSWVPSGTVITATRVFTEDVLCAAGAVVGAGVAGARVVVGAMPDVGFQAVEGGGAEGGAARDWVELLGLVRKGHDA